MPSVVTVNKSVCILSLASVAVIKYCADDIEAEDQLSIVVPLVVTGSFEINVW